MSWRDLMLDELGLKTNRIQMAVARHFNMDSTEYVTLGFLDDKSDRELFRIPGFGRKSLNVVRELIAKCKSGYHISISLAKCTSEAADG